MKVDVSFIWSHLSTEQLEQLSPREEPFLASNEPAC